MTLIWENQFWCGDCKCNHVIKVLSNSELSDYDKATFFAGGDYAEQFRKHTVCGNCGTNIVPHTNLTIVFKGERKEICPACARSPSLLAL
jgi:hypothetical protein